MKSLALLGCLMGTMLLLFSVRADALDCNNAMTQADMNTCASNDFGKADAELNTDYQQMLKRLGDSPEQTELFKTAQRAWLKFRDTECGFQGSGVEGGSAHPMIINSCMTRLTTGRVSDLKYYLTCEEGDLSCPRHP